MSIIQLIYANENLEWGSGSVWDQQPEYSHSHSTLLLLQKSWVFREASINVYCYRFHKFITFSLVLISNAAVDVSRFKPLHSTFCSTNCDQFSCVHRKAINNVWIFFWVWQDNCVEMIWKRIFWMNLNLFRKGRGGLRSQFYENIYENK